jgi:hypothetical protein
VVLAVQGEDARAGSDPGRAVGSRYPGRSLNGKEPRLSLQRCAHSGATLAGNATCGARCEAFPDCLPPPSPELAAAIALQLHEVAGEHEAATAIHEVLDRLHAAITEGLTRKEDP